jgi:predicted MFS family arabinose efflux permease
MDQALRSKQAQFALMVMFFTQGVASLSWMPRIPEFISNLHVSNEIWGSILGFGGAGAILPLVFTNKLVLRFGTTPIIKYSAIAIAIIISALPLATHWWVFLVLHFIMSIAFSTFNIALNSQAVAFQKRQGKVLLGSFHGAWSIGAATSAAISALIASYTPLLIHTLSLGVICLGLFLWSSSNMLTPQEDNHAQERDSGSKVSWFKTPKYLWLLSIGTFAGMWPELVIMDWSSVYGKKVLLLDAGSAALPYTCFIVAMIFGRFSIVKLTEKYQIARLSQIGGAFGSIALALAIFSSANLAASNQPLALLLLCLFFAIAGYGISSMVPGFYSATGHIDGLSTAQALSRMALFNYTVIIFAKMFMGSLIDITSLPLAMIFPIAMFAFASVISGFVASRTKRTERVDTLAYPPTSPITEIDVP